MKNNCIYFAEGKCEERLLNALKENPQKIQPGRVKVFNAVQNLLTKSQLVTIQSGTTVVLVFDTDVQNTEFLCENIRRLKTLCSKVRLVFLPQVLNLEDELVRCCEIKSVIGLTHSKSNKDFKRDFCSMTNVRSALDRVNLNVSTLWTDNVPSPFGFVESNSDEIKIK